MAAKRTSHDLKAAERNAMPDSAYAFPRVRKEPLNDASHVRNAIARFDQVEDVTDEERREAFRRIRRAAEKRRSLPRRSRRCPASRARGLC